MLEPLPACFTTEQNTVKAIYLSLFVNQRSVRKTVETKQDTCTAWFSKQIDSKSWDTSHLYKWISQKYPSFVFVVELIQSFSKQRGLRYASGHSVNVYKCLCYKDRMENIVEWEVQHLLMFLFNFFCSYYKMFREVRAPWLVRTSSLYFYKARALSHKSALSRYNARSLRHRSERANFTIHFIKKNKKTCSSSIIELYKHSRVFKNTQGVRKSRAEGECFSALFPRAYRSPHVR